VLLPLPRLDSVETAVVSQEKSVALPWEHSPLVLIFSGADSLVVSVILLHLLLEEETDLNYYQTIHLIEMVWDYYLKSRYHQRHFHCQHQQH
jgi:hypothetical protein